MRQYFWPHKYMSWSLLLVLRVLRLELDVRFVDIGGIFDVIIHIQLLDIYSIQLHNDVTWLIYFSPEFV